MSSEIIRTKIEVHAGEARRLMQHPLVGEFNYHVNRVNELQPELQRAIEQEATDTKAQPAGPPITEPQAAEPSENQK